MTIKISGALKKLYSIRFKSDPPSCNQKCHEVRIHKKNVIKLATVRLTPTLKFLSFRVSRNYLYFSFAKPGTDLLEYNELCESDSSHLHFQ